MLTHLSLQAVQKILNATLHSDAAAVHHIQTHLAGKRLRVVVLSPNMAVDCEFCATGKLHLEPAPTFEQGQAYTPFSQPVFNLRQLQSVFVLPAEATLSAATLSELFSLLGKAGGNIPVQGDYKVLQHVLGLVSLMRVNVAALLTPVLGVAAASQVQSAVDSIKAQVQKTSGSAAFMAGEWLEDSTLLAKQSDLSELSTQLITLNSDIDRLTARLAQLDTKANNLK